MNSESGLFNLPLTGRIFLD